MIDGSVVMVFARSRLQIRQLTTDAATQARTSFFHLAVGVIRYIVAKPAVTLGGNASERVCHLDSDGSHGRERD